MTLEIKVTETEEEFQETLAIRREVFVEEQNGPEDEEIDEYESISTHIIAYESGKPVGCARIRKVNDSLKLERIAVKKEARGKGFGKDLVKFMIDEAKKQNPKEIYMNAQYYLLTFYKSLGFQERGEKFDECGIDHIEMYLK